MLNDCYHARPLQGAFKVEMISLCWPYRATARAQQGGRWGCVQSALAPCLMACQNYRRGQLADQPVLCHNHIRWQILRARHAGLRAQQ